MTPGVNDLHTDDSFVEAQIQEFIMSSRHPFESTVNMDSWFSLKLYTWALVFLIQWRF